MTLDSFCFFFQAEDGIRDGRVTGVQTCALPILKFGPDLAVGDAGTFGDLASLRVDMDAGRIALLFVHGTNPAHSFPGAFTQALGKVGYKVSFASHMDETAAAADLILPDLHPLEQWNDSRPRAGI